LILRLQLQLLIEFSSKLRLKLLQLQVDVEVQGRKTSKFVKEIVLEECCVDIRMRTLDMGKINEKTINPRILFILNLFVINYI